MSSITTVNNSDDDSEIDMIFGVTARAIRYSDSDDDTISYESLKYENGLKERFKTISQNNMKERPTTPQINSLAIANGGCITVYENTIKENIKESLAAVSMASIIEKDEMMLEDMNSRGAHKEIEYVWKTGTSRAVVGRRSYKVGFCL
jgi:hypothetical protein